MFRTSEYDAVALLDVEPEMGARLPTDDLAAARRQLVVPGLQVDPGPWNPGESLARALGGLLTDGLALCETQAFGRTSMQLFGAGDLVEGAALADPDATWRVLEPVRLAILDGRFLLAARKWPQLVSGLAERLFACQHEQHVLAAITAMPRVEERVLAFMGHLAVRWGCVAPDGLLLHLPVTHQVLGQLVGARRPTVSLALSFLREQGLLRRRPDGRWLLPVDCVDWPEVGVPGRAVAAAAAAGTEAASGEPADGQPLNGATPSKTLNSVLERTPSLP
jgi:CRP-like cAMP-binding protein